MKLILSILVVVTTCFISLESFSQPAGRQNNATPPSATQPPTQQRPTIAGKPFEQAQAIVERYRQEFKKTAPFIYHIGIGPEGAGLGVVVYTNEKGVKPTELPAHIKALRSTTLDGIPVVHVDPLYILPPPSGVIVLKPGGVRETATSCPAGYLETERLTWRFCVNPMAPETIPALMSLPVNGIPYEKAKEIVDRHKEKLISLPGVSAVGLGETGIYVELRDPSVLPKEIEGLPFEIHPYVSERENNNHTVSTQIRPVRGALAISTNAVTSGGTLGGVAFSGGGMWLITAAHVLGPPYCTSPPPCTTATLGECLDRCPTGSTPLYQPPTYVEPFAANRIGWAVKWTPLTNDGGHDVAAVWLDNDRNKGNSSVCADRQIETWGNITGVGDAVPARGEILYLTTIYDNLIPPYGHQKHVKVEDVDLIVNRIRGCGVIHTTFNQLVYRSVRPPTYTTFGQPFEQGESGSLVLDQNGTVAAVHQWSGPLTTNIVGGGVMASYARMKLGFSFWYGTSTFPNNAQVCQ